MAPSVTAAAVNPTFANACLDGVTVRDVNTVGIAAGLTLEVWFVKFPCLLKGPCVQGTGPPGPKRHTQQLGLVQA